MFPCIEITKRKVAITKEKKKDEEKNKVERKEKYVEA